MTGEEIEIAAEALTGDLGRKTEVVDALTKFMTLLYEIGPYAQKNLETALERTQGIIGGPIPDTADAMQALPGEKLDRIIQLFQKASGAEPFFDVSRVTEAEQILMYSQVLGLASSFEDAGATGSSIVVPRSAVTVERGARTGEGSGPERDTARARAGGTIFHMPSNATHLSPADRAHLDLAVAEARIGWDEGGVPIGAALVRHGRDGDEVLAVGRNRRVQMGSVIRHGETDCLENAGRLPASVYRECTLYTTLSPCTMCAGTAILYEIPRIVIGENRSFEASESWLRGRGTELVVANDAACIALMDRMMRERPEIWAEDIGVDASELGVDARVLGVDA